MESRGAEVSSPSPTSSNQLCGLGQGTTLSVSSIVKWGKSHLPRGDIVKINMSGMPSMVSIYDGAQEIGKVIN